MKKLTVMAIAAAFSMGSSVAMAGNPPKPTTGNEVGLQKIIDSPVLQSTQSTGGSNRPKTGNEVGF